MQAHEIEPEKGAGHKNKTAGNTAHHSKVKLALEASKKEETIAGSAS